MLVGPPSPTYVPGACATAASGNNSDGKYLLSVQGVNSNPSIPFPDSMYNTLNQRLGSYGCQGGAQSAYGTTDNYVTCSSDLYATPSDDAAGGEWTYDAFFCPMQPECLNGFSYSWFPNLESSDETNWRNGTWLPAGQAALDTLFFRLPAFDITRRNCTKSPFINASLPANVRQKVRLLKI